MMLETASVWRISFVDVSNDPFKGAQKVVNSSIMLVSCLLVKSKWWFQIIFSLYMGKCSNSTQNWMKECFKWVEITTLDVGPDSIIYPDVPSLKPVGALKSMVGSWKLIFSRWEMGDKLECNRFFWVHPHHTENGTRLQVHTPWFSHAKHLNNWLFLEIRNLEIISISFHGNVWGCTVEYFGLEYIFPPQWWIPWGTCPHQSPPHDLGFSSGWLLCCDPC